METNQSGKGRVEESFASLLNHMEFQSARLDRAMYNSKHPNCRDSNNHLRCTWCESLKMWAETCECEPLFCKPEVSARKKLDTYNVIANLTLAESISM